jgi:polar amino acid transport system permease protein
MFSFLNAFFNHDVLRDSTPALLQGFVTTLLLGFASILIGVPAGAVVGLIRLYGPKPLRVAMMVYIDIFRALPVLVVLIMVYYALPMVGIEFSDWTSVILVFSCIMAAYSAEVFRAGFESIPRGQFEAASALGIPFLVTLRKVVLPQAIRIVIPPTANNCVSMIKDTSLASTVALPELLKQAQNAQAFYANASPLIGAGLVYLVFLWPMVRLVNVLEKRFQSEKSR